MKRKSFFRHSTKSEPAKYEPMYGEIHRIEGSSPDVLRKQSEFAEHMPRHERRQLVKGTSAEELSKQIKKVGSFSEIWERHKKQIVHQTLSDYLTSLRMEKKLKRSEIVVRTGLDKAYVYQIFAGKKNPSRDKLITIAFGMKLNEDETQRMLQLYGYRELWPKDERDALFLFAIQHGKSLEYVHTELERCGLNPLAAPVK